MKRNIIVLAIVVVVVAGMLIAGRYAARRTPAQPGTVASGGAPGKGAAAPDFTLTATDGRKVKLSELRGKAVLLNFWATWCPPCKIEIPWFVDLQKQYGPQGLEIVGVAMDDDAEKNRDDITKFAKEMNINYTILLGNEEVGEQYGGVQALPTTFYIGRDGKVVNRVFGLVSHSEVEKSIQDALKQGQAGEASGQ